MSRVSIRVGQEWRDSDRRSRLMRFVVEELVAKNGEPAARVRYLSEPPYRTVILERRLQAGGYHGGAYRLTKQADDHELAQERVDAAMDEIVSIQSLLLQLGGWEDVVDELGDAIKSLHIARDILSEPEPDSDDYDVAEEVR